MKVQTAIQAWDGKFLSVKDTGEVTVEEGIGPWELFTIDVPDAPVAPPKPVDPPKPIDPTRTPQQQFALWVAGKPFGQQTLLDLEPTLNAAGWALTPPNANRERTKVLPPSGPWTRVGFGEGYWVWIEQK